MNFLQETLRYLLLSGAVESKGALTISASPSSLICAHRTDLRFLVAFGCSVCYFCLHAVAASQLAKVGNQRGVEHSSWCLLYVWHLLQLLLQDATWL